MTGKKLRQPQVGEAAPDFSLLATDGSTVTLADYPKPLSITFFRHLA
jgi:peroxiredoxin